MNSPLMSGPWINRLIGDSERYRLHSRLGGDSMGELFVAIDTRLGRQVALKLLNGRLIAAQDLRERFKREMILFAALKSDHIVQVKDYGVTAESHPFYVMEYLRGQTLGQLLRCEPRLSVERTVGIISQVCRGLHVAHQGVSLRRNGAIASEHIKVVHGDLKPDNIFLVTTPQGEIVKILDFGVARIRHDCCEDTNLTGMFHYAAPEQLGVERDLDERADIYSLGIILYEMLSGTLAHTSTPPVPLRSQPESGQVSPQLEEVVMRCLPKSPDERFASVDELQRALQAAVAVTQPPSTNEDETKLNKTIVVPPEVEDKKKVRRSLLKATGAAGFFIIVGLAIYASYIIAGQNGNQRAAIERLKSLKEEKNYEECVNQAKAVTQKSSFYTDAQNLMHECQRLAQDKKWLAQAQELAKENNLKGAIAEASKIQPDSIFSHSAQQNINQYSENLLKQAEERYKKSYNSKDLENAINITQDIPKTSSVAKNAESTSKQWQTEWNKNENYLQAAQNALQLGKGQEVIATANQVRLLGQQVKQDTPYWLHKIKPIIEAAEKRIAASKSQESETNDLAKPEPPLSDNPLPPRAKYVPNPPVPSRRRLVRLPPRQPLPPPIRQPIQPRQRIQPWSITIYK